MVRSSRRSASPEIPPPPADMAPLSWLKWFRHAVDELVPALGRVRAEQQVYEAARAEFHRRDRRQPSPSICAGCLKPIEDDGDRLMIDGVAVHARRASCRSDATFRRLRADRMQLHALGLTPPKGGR